MRIGYFIQGMMLVIPLLFVSCNNTEHLFTESKVVCSISEFESDNLSRTNIDPNNSFSITWASGDVVGIFPLEGYQEPFEIPTSQANSSSATFDGGYWDIKDGLKYNAYYPFDKKNFDSAEMKTKIPVSYIGQKQCGTSCDIGAFDYTYSKWTTASNGSVYFEFDHIGAIAVFSLKYPATTTYETFTLSVNESVIPLFGTYNLKNAKIVDDNNSVDRVAFVADENSWSNSISLELTNCFGVAGETGVFYMMLPPMNLSSNEVTLSLISSAGTTCTYSIEKVMDIKKGKFYQRTGIPRESNVDGTIDEWGSNYSNGVAYVVAAGELSSIIAPDEMNSITSLKVVGKLNGTDIKFIREMAGKDVNAHNTEGRLANLDLTEATIVEGGDCYYDNSYSQYYTTDNEIGKYMFDNTNLQNIVLPNNVVSVKEFAFMGSDLNGIDIPESVISIGENAFRGCTSLTSVEIGNGVTSIGDMAFFECTSLSSVTIGNGVVSIGHSAFKYCSALKNVYIPDNVTSIGDNAFHVCGSLTSVIIGDGVTSIGSSAFADCSSLSSVVIGDNVTSIGDQAFYGSSIVSINIPNSVISIGEYSFYGCLSMVSATIGASVASIGQYAFYYCPSLNQVFCYATTPPSLGYFWPYSDDGNKTLFVPKGCITKYRSSDWKYYFTNVMEVD